MQPMIKAWGHQTKAIEAAAGRLAEGFALFMGMGTGKTKTSLDILFSTEGSLDKYCLVLVPKIGFGVWHSEIIRNYPHMEGKVILLNKSSKDNGAIMRDYIASGLKGYIFLVNYESVWRNPLGTMLIKYPPSTIIADESHKLKSPSSKVSRYMQRLGLRTTNRLILTGTPMPNGFPDIYAQFRFLNGKIFGTSLKAFQDRFCIMGGFEGRQVMGCKDPTALGKIIASHSFSVKTEDVIDLPPMLHTDIDLFLPPSQMEEYKKLRKESILWLEEGGEAITPSNALVKALRLQQYVNGNVPKEDTTFKKTNHVKIDAVRDFLTDISEEVVIFTRFTAEMNDIRQLCAELDVPYYEISGRSNDLEMWKKDPKGVVCIQIQAGGVSISLTEYNRIIYFTHPYSYGDYEQSFRRVCRPPQDKTVYIYHLVVQDTIDKQVIRALGEKKSLIEFILKEGYK
jgi:SNF2 family DNA or RNA helicase